MAVTDPVTHRIARQEGLLQLAYMESERYGCDFDWEKDKDLPVHDNAKTILQPKNNLECGVKILDNQLMAKRQALLNKTSYWVTLRPGQPSFHIFMKQMVNVPAFCGAKFRRPSPMQSNVEAAKTAVQPESAKTASTSGSNSAIKSAVTGSAAAATH